jgi:preprotein translocase subunit SecA
MNMQRSIIYKQRREVLDGNDMRDNVIAMMNDACEMVVSTYTEEILNPELNRDAFLNEVKTTFGITELESLNKKHTSVEAVIEELQDKVLKRYEERANEVGDDIKELERFVILKVVDTKWMEHIDSMDSLKNGIGLRAYAQKDPVVQYRIEGGNMFDEMIATIKLDVTKILLHVAKKERKLERESNVRITTEGLDRSAIEVGESAPKANAASDSKPQPIVNNGPKVGRNDPCPCGSGRKYKMCHGK